ncbi:DUF4349 domain-containing protein [Nostocoides veronense]|uniref:DUF4349 domain-containing protein n=1 Tax=Nostocoides veronense TaxID=330836 RepID=A0ABP4XVS2_9MICO
MSSITRRTPSARAALAVVTAACAVTLAGCSGGSTSSVAGGYAATSSASAGDVAQDAASAAVDPAKRGTTVAPVAVAVEDQKLARNATLSLKVRSINEAVDKVRAINATAGGYILTENVGSYRDGGAEGVTPDTYAAISISVPTDKLDATLDELQKIGQVLDRRSETENVTAEFVDTRARVESMKRSVARIQDLMDSTKDMEQLVRLERELSSRQTELEAVEARLQQLDRETSRSPVTINLTTQEELVEGLSSPKEGFLGGLAAGWTAFVGSLVGLMTVIGALLPFALFAGLVAWPLWLLIRRFLRERRTPTANPAPEPSA